MTKQEVKKMAQSAEAYDFELFEGSAVRKRRVEEAPQQVVREPEILEFTAPKKHTKSLPKLLKMLAVVLCGAIIFSLAASLLYSQAKLTEASENLADTQKVLLEQQSVETQLRSRLTEKYTEDYIESYVADRYNMRKATQSQIQYFSVHQNDLGKVVQSEEGGPIARFLRQIFG